MPNNKTSYQTSLFSILISFFTSECYLLKKISPILSNMLKNVTTEEGCGVSGKVIFLLQK